MLAVVISVANVFRRVWWPYDATLGRVPGLAGLHDTAQHPEAELLAGATILRFDAPLIFANANTFRDRVRELSEPLPPVGGSSSRPSRSPTSTPPPATCSRTSSAPSRHGASGS